ncbi:MAG TPA: glycosyltransferase family 2 protein [Candidatus Angelobacter sp.]
MLSVVIPAGGGVPRLRCTLACVAAAVRADATDTEVIVVNDGGALEIRECVDECAHPSAVEFKIVEIPRGGRSKARNAGAALARGDRILFIDSDILPEREVLRFHSCLGPEAARFLYRGTIVHLPWLAAFEDPVSGELTAEAAHSLRLRSGSNACLLASRTLSAEALENPGLLRNMARGTPFQRDLQRWFHANPSDVIASWIGCTGGQLSVDRSVFETLGGFDESMGLRWGAEDLEFGYRAAQAGIATRYAERSLCYHMDHSISGRAGDHDWALEYFARKHGNDGVLRLLDYFAGKCSLTEAMEACHAPA